MAVRSKGAARPQSVASPMFNSSSSSSSAATKKLKGRNLGVRKASSNHHAATAKREEREIRAALRGKARAAPKAAKARGRTTAAGSSSSCRTAVLDFVEETLILCGYEKTFRRSRLRGVHLGFGVCRRLLFG